MWWTQIRAQTFVCSKWAMVFLVPQQALAVSVIAGWKEGLCKPQTCTSSCRYCRAWLYSKSHLALPRLLCRERAGPVVLTRTGVTNAEIGEMFYSWTFKRGCWNWGLPESHQLLDKPVLIYRCAQSSQDRSKVILSRVTLPFNCIILCLLLR